MSVFRFIAIILPMTVLVACGGGGGGGTAMTGTPTSIPPGTGDSVMPPPTVTPENLPDALIANAEVARMRTGGSEVMPDMDSAQIKQTLRSIASASGSEVIFSDIIETSSATPTSRTITCTANNRSCSGVLSDGTTITYSLDNFGGIPRVDNEELAGFNDEYSLVMTDRNVTLGQVRAAGRLDGVRFEFQSYGGWLTNSAFAVQSEIADGSGSSDISYLTAYSFGAASGTNPTLEPGQAFWNGVVVGKSVETGHLFQGDASVVITALSRGVQNSIANITFNALTNFNTGESLNPLTWSNLALDRGSFTSNSGDIQGTFYGTDHEEVGGIFNRDNILGSFGATRQTQ